MRRRRDTATGHGAGRAAGLRERYFAPMGSFLLEGGILEHMPKGDDKTAFVDRARLKTLFHPGGMGERFKVLVQERPTGGLRR